MANRVVITGLGAISSVGIGREEFWDSLVNGRSGVGRISSFDTSDYPAHYGAEIRGLELDRLIKSKRLNGSGRATRMAVGASRLAVNDSGLETDVLRSDRAAVSIGTTLGESQVFQDFNEGWIRRQEEGIDPKFIIRYPYGVLSKGVAAEFKCGGPNITLLAACAAGNHAIGCGYDLIRTGRTDIVLAGGADAFSRIAFCGFNRLYSIAPLKCQPFDRNRKGMLLGEGAGILVLESLAHALKRRADIYAEIAGYSVNCDASHMAAPSADGIARVMQEAIVAAGLAAEDIGYISAHGTGTVSNDRAECIAIKKVFKNYRNIPVSSIKSMLGHAMGAASALEAIACAMVIKSGIIPPTINYETPDPECDIDCVPNSARNNRVEAALNNAFAFGANNSSVVIKRCRS